MAEVVIPTKQKAAIYDQPGTVSTKVVELDVPDPGPGEVLINLLVYVQSTLCTPAADAVADPTRAYATRTLE